MDPIEFAPEPSKPDLPGTVVVRDSVEELVDAIAADLYYHSKMCVRSFGDFHLALSGGSTPLPLYRRLMIDPNLRDFPWTRTHLWVVDERCVPFEDERSNFRTLREMIVDHSDIPPEQVHPITATSPTAARDYEQQLQDTLAWREKGHDRLDFVLLGMGDDGHTASLFPHSPALDDEDRLVLANTGPTVTPPDRITLTYKLINSSRFIAIMVSGSSKKDAIKEAVQGGSVADLPILGVNPVGGEQRWYLDRAACP